MKFVLPLLFLSCFHPHSVPTSKNIVMSNIEYSGSEQHPPFRIPMSVTLCPLFLCPMLCVFTLSSGSVPLLPNSHISAPVFLILCPLFLCPKLCVLTLSSSVPLLPNSHISDPVFLILCPLFLCPNSQQQRPPAQFPYQCPCVPYSVSPISVSNVVCPNSQQQRPPAQFPYQCPCVPYFVSPISVS